MLQFIIKLQSLAFLLSLIHATHGHDEARGVIRPRELRCPSGYTICADGTACCNSPLPTPLPACPSSGTRCAGEFSTICCLPGSTCGGTDGLCQPTTTESISTGTSPFIPTTPSGLVPVSTKSGPLPIGTATGATDACRAVGGACVAGNQCQRQGGKPAEGGVVCSDQSLTCCTYGLDDRCKAQGGVACISTDLCKANNAFSSAQSLCPGPSYLQCCMSMEAAKNATRSSSSSSSGSASLSKTTARETASPSGAAVQLGKGRSLGMADAVIGALVGVLGII